jgi:hypothetical protein
MMSPVRQYRPVVVGAVLAEDQFEIVGVYDVTGPTAAMIWLTFVEVIGSPVVTADGAGIGSS